MFKYVVSICLISLSFSSSSYGMDNDPALEKKSPGRAPSNREKDRLTIEKKWESIHQRPLGKTSQEDLAKLMGETGASLRTLKGSIEEFSQKVEDRLNPSLKKTVKKEIKKAANFFKETTKNLFFEQNEEELLISDVKGTNIPDSGSTDEFSDNMLKSFENVGAKLYALGQLVETSGINKDENFQKTFGQLKQCYFDVTIHYQQELNKIFGKSKPFQQASAKTPVSFSPQKKGEFADLAGIEKQNTQERVKTWEKKGTMEAVKLKPSPPKPLNLEGIEAKSTQENREKWKEMEKKAVDAKTLPSSIVLKRKNSLQVLPSPHSPQISPKQGENRKETTPQALANSPKEKNGLRFTEQPSLSSSPQISSKKNLDKNETSTQALANSFKGKNSLKRQPSLSSSSSSSSPQISPKQDVNRNETSPQDLANSFKGKNRLRFTGQSSTPSSPQMSPKQDVNRNDTPTQLRKRAVTASTFLREKKLTFNSLFPQNKETLTQPQEKKPSPPVASTLRGTLMPENIKLMEKDLQEGGAVSAIRYLDMLKKAVKNSSGLTSKEDELFNSLKAEARKEEGSSKDEE